MKRTLRPYQQQAIDATLEKLNTFDSTVVVLPTGCGKTVYASRLISEWERGNTLFMAHTRELVYQAADKLSAELGYSPAIEMNITTAEVESMYQGGFCVVGSVQTMSSAKRLFKYRKHPFGLIVIDECHHATSSTYRKVIDYFREMNPSLKVVGITATPNRSDGAAIGMVFQSEAFQMTISDAIDEGWLVPVEQEFVVCESVNYDKIQTKKNEFGESDFNAASLEQVMTEEENLQAVAGALIQKAGDKPTLVFCSGVMHAKLLASILNRHRSGCAQSVSGETDKKDRQEIIGNFSGGKLQFLTNCQVLTEGFDAPNCSLVAMARPTKSLSLYMQMLGRGLRPLPGVVDGIPEPFDRKMSIMTSAKPTCHVLDFVGNSNHKLAGAFDVLGGNYDAETRALASEESKKGKQKVSELLEQAKALRELELQWHNRRHIVANVNFQAYNVDPFGHGAAPAVQKASKGRGGSSDAQIGLLVNLGVSYEEAASYSKKQAGAVIDSLGKTRCTKKQAAALARAGVNPNGIGLDRAGRILDALARNGWTPLKEIPE